MELHTPPAEKDTNLMPVLFVGHGSPMNAIQDNDFVRSWKNLGETLPVPRSILCVSAHWQTRGTRVTAMPHPPTIHDFGGFPPELYEIQYPAPGDPELAGEIMRTTTAEPDEKWGLDHGTWSILRHMYPDARIPVVELSLDSGLTPRGHYEFARQLFPFREKGILILCSGNIVHNLQRIAWDKAAEEEFGFDWAIRATGIIKQRIMENRHDELIDYLLLGRDVQLAAPTPEHFLPLLYALALKNDEEPLSFFNDKHIMGSLSMTSVKVGE
ncbi:MAG TPA: 4,5-DOPA dioxygenase extradiol [Paludibacter sp.]|nr:4,5-DOPA dioxygenase extradiol [Paludibacter sp.]